MKTLVTLGPKGSFSEVCASTHLQDGYTIQLEHHLHHIFERLSNQVDILVPLENTTDGFVYQTLDGLIAKGGYIIQTFNMPIHFACLGNLDNAKYLYAQFVTQQQCQRFLQKHHHLEVITTASNAASINYINHESVAIVPMHFIHDAYPHVDYIEDFAWNETRFALISTEQKLLSGNQASMIITPHVDRPGLLYDILTQFKKHHINLTAILSRPNKKTSKQYHFYIEMDVSHSHEEALKEVIDHIQTEFNVSFLGQY